MQTKNIDAKSAAGRYAFGGNFVKGTRINVSGHYSDNTAINDNGDGTVDIAITGHGFVTGDEVVVTGSVESLDGTYTVTKKNANAITITAAYVAETPAANTMEIKGQGHITLDKDASIVRLLAETNCRMLWDTTSDSDITQTGTSRDAAWLRAQQPWEEKIPGGLYGGGPARSSNETIYVHIMAESLTQAAKYVDHVQQ